ncbi:MBL fold metallo-hydrolase [Rhodopila sp.]|uniref:MBL fold metallo-hydrolase n=1 Tax=Rhodopila sp. TaxID=2480087 RepID=UPI003D0D2B1C
MRRVLALYIVFIPAVLAAPYAALAGCAPVAFSQSRVWTAAAVDESVKITFLGHASFEIVSPAGVRAITDYNGINIPSDPPDIATMNHAHSTHYTLDPDPRIPYVLHGWRENDRIPAFDLVVRDMHVTSLPTNIRALDGGTELYGNSIFVFETGGLCIAHLSHLHHILTQADLDTLGHIDIVMVAVDGIWTMSQQNAAQVVEQLQPRVVLPMHYFTSDVLSSFLDLERDKFAVDVRDSPVLDVSRTTLPAVPTVIALLGGY